MVSAQEIMREWYLILNQVSTILSGPIKQVADSAQIPLSSAFLFGLIGALSPCQLTTNLSAMSFVTRHVGNGRVWSHALAYALGKISVYMLLGGSIIFLGFQVQHSMIPVATMARKIVGPSMLLIGLGLTGIIRLQASFGTNFGRWLQSRFPQRGVLGTYFLGILFSFTFCPTLFWLFFGLMIPLALTTPGGSTFPALFALGTTLPLLIFAGLVDSQGSPSSKLTDWLMRHGRRINQIAGAVFILAGINDTLIYWLM